MPKRSRSRRSSSGMGGMKAIFKGAVAGMGIYYLTGNALISGVGGYLVAGVPGAAAGYLAPTIKSAASGTINSVLGVKATTSGNSALY